MLGVTVVLFGLVVTLVDLKPVVEENFFFSTSDPQFRRSKKIEQHFPAQPELILSVSSRDISSERYLSRIAKLTQRIGAIRGHTSQRHSNPQLRLPSLSGTRVAQRHVQH